MITKKLSAAICVLITLTIWLGACASAAPAEALVGTPTYEQALTPIDGEVIAARRPVISWTVYPNGNAISNVRMQFDGKEVRPIQKANGTGVTYSYQPAADLVPGSHAASVTVTFDGYQPVTVSSRFTITNNPVDPIEGKDGAAWRAMETEAVNHLNTLRQTLGLSQLSINRDLTLAAQSHSNFLQINNLISHYQNANYPVFTGITPQNRASFFGFSGVVSEAIHFGSGSPRMSMEGLIDAPYHRLVLIDPNDREIGAGFSRQSANMVVNTGTTGARDADRAIMYPYPGQTNAKSAWFDDESPNPLAFYKKEHLYTGYPVSLSFYDDKTKELRLVSASFTDSSGAKIPHYVVDSTKEDQFKKHVFLIAQSPLKPGTTYTVRIEAQRILADDSVKPVKQEWSFTTRAGYAIDYLGLISQGGIDNLEIRLKNGDIPDVEYLLLQDGEVVRRFNTAQGFSWPSGAMRLAGAYRLQLISPSLSPNLTEYAIEIKEADGKRSAVITGAADLGPIPIVRASLLRLGGTEHIELIWQDKTVVTGYVLKRGGEVWRSYKNNLYYAGRGDMTLPAGQYQLEVSRAGATEPQHFTLTLSGPVGDRRVDIKAE